MQQNCLVTRKEYYRYVDFARALAIIFVVLCHCTETFYYDVLIQGGKISLPLWIIENSLFTIGRIGVPLFLMITGNLMLKKDIKPYEFHKKYLFPLLITVEIWIVVGYFCRMIIDEFDFSLNQLLKEMLFLIPSDFPQMWYMPMILGMYVVLPYLSSIVKRYSINDLILPIIIILVTNFIFPLINVFSANGFSSILDISFMGGQYGIYIILGYYVGNTNIFKKISTNKRWLLIFSMFLCNTFLQYKAYLINDTTSSIVWYSSPFILIISAILYSILRDVPSNRIFQCNLIVYISRISFGLFLTHKLIIELICKSLLRINFFMSLNQSIQMLILFIVTLIILLILFIPCSYNNKILNPIKKLIFYIR